MEEELSLDNILGAEEIENLFVEDEDTQAALEALAEDGREHEGLDRAVHQMPLGETQEVGHRDGLRGQQE